MISFLKKQTNDADPESERLRVMTFRYYLLLVAGIFFTGLVLELIVDFKAGSAVTFTFLTVVPLLLFILSLKRVPHQWLLIVNMISLFALNEFQVLLYPKGFHVLVFWLGLSPLLAAVLMKIRETIFWTILILILILINGLYVNNIFPSYEMTLYPSRFTYGGLLFALMIATVAILFSYTNYLNHKRLSEQNQKLQSQGLEIERQNDQLKDQHEEITLINDKLEQYNQHLEERVHERTEELESKNRKLTEYAFINSHLLRGPLSRVLGLVNLLNLSSLTDREREILNHLSVAGTELDDVITKINKAIDSGHTFDRDTFRKLKQ